MRKKDERHRLLANHLKIGFNSRPSHEILGKFEEESADKPKPDQNPDATSDGATDPVEEALAEALKSAASAGEWATVAVLAKELEARRMARATNVVDLGTRRRK